MLSSFQFKATWQNLLDTLGTRLPDWPERVKALGQVSACEARKNGHLWSDAEVVKGLLWGLLSANTDWQRVERCLPDLQHLFADYQLAPLCQYDATWVGDKALPWFRARQAGSQYLRQGLKRFLRSCHQLAEHAEKHQTLEKWLQAIWHLSGHDPVRMALALGAENGKYKLPGFGIALVAEGLKNLGFSVGKPDIHICRIAGSWGAVQFKKWPDQSGTKAPVDPGEKSLREVMIWVAEMAQELELEAVYVDNVLWLAAAKSGAWLSNDTFKALGAK